jgi:hypothetical protein
MMTDTRAAPQPPKIRIIMACFLRSLSAARNSPAPSGRPMTQKMIAHRRNLPAGSELGTLPDYHSAFNGEARMARVLHETLVLFCAAAFITGLVIAAAALVG